MSLKKQENRWICEGYDKAEQVVVEVADMKESVVIIKCKSSVIKIVGKCNAISIINCESLGVLFETAIATCEITNCKKTNVQVEQTVPIVQVDNTDGCNVYISAQCKDSVKIYSSGSMALNVIALGAPEEDPIECPVPQSFCSTFQGKKLVTVPVTDI